MGQHLTGFEQLEPFAGNYASALAESQRQIAELQLAQIVHRQRAIILVDGWDGGGRDALLRRLVAAMDPSHVVAHRLVDDESRDGGRHWLARFWNCLPRSGQTVIFNGSWYRLLAERRLAGELDDRSFARACDEINEFEAQQRDHGTSIVKLFLHIPNEVHVERLRRQESDPWRRWLIDPAEVDGIDRRGEYVAAWEAMFAQTDTRWSPWRIINASDKRRARLSALGTIAADLQKLVPLDPPGEEHKVLHFPTQQHQKIA